MRRTRVVLVDNTTGTIYTNVTKPSAASKASIIAGAKPSTVKTTVSKAGKSVSIVNSNKPISPRREVLVTFISMEVTASRGLSTSAAAPFGNNLTVRYRKVSSNGTTTTLGTHSITSGNTSYSTSVSYPLTNTDKLFIDVTSIGTTAPGLGLIVYTTYFG